MVEHMMNMLILVILGGRGRGEEEESLGYFRRVILVGEIARNSRSSVTWFLMAHALVLGEETT